jgi:hypothetical protein
MSEDKRFALAIGGGAVRLWPDLPREIQERLFEEAVGADVALRHALAQYLHDCHPRTAHPPDPPTRRDGRLGSIGDQGRHPSSAVGNKRE